MISDDGYSDREILDRILLELMSKRDITSLITIYHATILTKGTEEEIIKKYEDTINKLIKDILENLKVEEKINADHKHIIKKIINFSNDYANRKLFSTIFFQKDINYNIKEFLNFFPNGNIEIYEEEDIKIYLAKENIKGKIVIPDFIIDAPPKRVAIELSRITGISGSNLDKKILKILKRRKDIEKLKADYWFLVIQVGISKSNTDDIISYFSGLFENILPTFFNPKRVYGLVIKKIKDVEEEIKQNKNKLSKDDYKKILNTIKYNIEYLTSRVQIESKTIVLPFYIMYDNKLDKKIMEKYIKENQKKFVEYLKEIFS
ncbi:hypothetical protein YN1_7960 [Nanoarchaeota archaeon]